MSARHSLDTADTGSRPQPAQRHSCRVSVGPWRIVLPTDRQLWNRGPARRPAPDRGVQLDLFITTTTEGTDR